MSSSIFCWNGRIPNTFSGAALVGTVVSSAEWIIRPVPSSGTLADETTSLKMWAYIDLIPLAAGITFLPEQSPHASVNGKRSVSASNLLDFAQTLNVSLDYLMTGKASEEQQAEVSIPSSLPKFAADAGLSLRKTLMLSDMQKQIVAHHSAKNRNGLEAVGWQKLYEGVKESLESE